MLKNDTSDILGTFLQRDQFTDQQYSGQLQEDTMPTPMNPMNPRMRYLDTILDRNRMIWDRTSQKSA